MVANDMGTKQTAVDYYIKEQYSLAKEASDLSWEEILRRNDEIYIQAKQMHKEQIKEAYDKGIYNVHPFHNSEEYYNAIYATHLPS